MKTGISLSGDWVLTVLSKGADFDQRYVVSGATTGDAVIPSDSGLVPHVVTGAKWDLTVQSLPTNSDSWVDSDTVIAGWREYNEARRRAPLVAFRNRR